MSEHLVLVVLIGRYAFGMDRVMADHMLEAGGIDPTLVRRYLGRIDPAQVRVVVAPGWFRRLWAKGTAAVCLPWAIYIQPEIMDRFRRGDGLRQIATLITHELTHLEQYRRLGAIRHGFRYAADYVVGRRRRLGHWGAYRAIGLEREARYVADLITNEAT